MDCKLELFKSLATKIGLNESELMNQILERRQVSKMRWYEDENGSEDRPIWRTDSLAAGLVIRLVRENTSNWKFDIAIPTDRRECTTIVSHEIEEECSPDNMQIFAEVFARYFFALQLKMIDSKTVSFAWSEW